MSREPAASQKPERLIWRHPCRERQAEILADERVVAAREAGRGGRVRTPQETAAAASVTLVGDGRGAASPPGANGAAAPAQSNGSAPVVRSIPLHPAGYIARRDCEA
jgi:hypothetical protein